MDIERGNIEIVFQKIPYMYVIKSWLEMVDYCSYSKIEEDIYMRYSSDVFPCATDDERRNNYLFMCSQMKFQTDLWKNDISEDIGVFQLVFSVANKMLRLDGNEIKCKFDQLLRWREISLLMGQDFFTCAYLAYDDWKKGYNTQYFAWLPIIRSDNSRLHNILEQGVAENHFHLNGSTKIFELNWLCLMNHISSRNAEFKKITRTMQMQRNDSFDKRGIKEDFYTECLRAALYRGYLFFLIKENSYMFGTAEALIKKVENGISLREITSDIQNLIDMAGNLYGTKINGAVLDYALENEMMKYNDNVCRLLAGERKFLYCCYRCVLTGKFDRFQKNIFYAYLIMRTDFRGELIQSNKKIGFGNFSDYQDRKEFFIEGHKPYEDELVRLALNESLTKKNMLSLEARICPKNTSAKLIKNLKKYKRIVKSEPVNDGYDKLIYVLHLYYYYHFNKKVREKGNEVTEFKVTKEYIKLVRIMQDKMIAELACKGIGIETNPSSNYLIGTIKKYEEHPILRFNSRKLKATNTGENLCVSINTDDQGVFDTLLENEYALMTLALKKATDDDMNALYDIEDIYEWSDYVRRMGIDQVFS